MLQAILVFKFELNLMEETITPEMRLIQSVFSDMEKYKRDDYGDLITYNDLYAILSLLTSKISSGYGEFSRSCFLRLMETPFRAFASFRQELDEHQFISLSIFDLDDRIEIFEDIINRMTKKLENLFIQYIKAINAKKISLIEKVNEGILDELKFTLFQVERFSNLDLLQKAALIFIRDERLKILEILRDHPVSERDLKKIIKLITPNPFFDILLDPFIDLNLVKTIWLKGEKDKGTLTIKHQGKFLTLLNDIKLIRVKNNLLMNRIKKYENGLFKVYEEKVNEFFSNYDPYNQTIEETKGLALLLLNPDVYDFITLFNNNFYPTDKIPKILSPWANVLEIMDILKDLRIISEIQDEKNRSWTVLLTKIEYSLNFPETSYSKIKRVYDSKASTEEISLELASQYLDLFKGKKKPKKSKKKS